MKLKTPSSLCSPNQHQNRINPCQGWDGEKDVTFVEMEVSKEMDTLPFPTGLGA